MPANDDFPYSSDDPSLQPLDENSEVLSLTSQQLSDLKATPELAESALRGQHRAVDPGSLAALAIYRPEREGLSEGHG
jgi:hypothetical protein